MQRTKTVVINGKTIIISERTVGELKALYAKYRGEIEGMIGANSLEDGEKAVSNLLYDKLTELFPVLTVEDIDKSYPSELEELIGGFIEVNFTGVKKVASPIMNLILTGLKK